MTEPTLPSRVRVKTWAPPGHIRTPGYLRGKTGEIERRLPAFPNPELLAYRLPAPEAPLLRVRVTMAEIWGPDTPHPDDTLDAEIYAHWLEPADAP